MPSKQAGVATLFPGREFIQQSGDEFPRRVGGLAAIRCGYGGYVMLGGD
jgi:hypothetical protein